MTELETRLRGELTAAARDVRISTDAWQRNQRLIATDRSGRRSRVTWMLSTAAVVLAVATASSLVLGGGDGPTGAAKPTGDDPLSQTRLLGPILLVEDLTLDGDGTVHEMALTDVNGKGPSLCDRYVGSNSSTGGCTAREPAADTDQVAFDWLSGTEGDGTIRGVIGGVDNRIAAVAIWMTNGERVETDLQVGSADGSKLFGYTVTAGGPTPIRLAAYDEEGDALEYVNLATRFGAEWVGNPANAVAGCSLVDGCRIEDLDPGMLAQVARHDDRVVVLVWPDVNTILFDVNRGGDPRQFVVDSPGLLVIRSQFDRSFFGGPIPDDLIVSVDDGTNSTVRPVPAFLGTTE
jgi:hypothetical protein